jgi:hypothetical protein
MKKTDRKLLDDALDKALAPPRKMPRQALDSLLDEYDEPTAKVEANENATPVPEYRSTEALKTQTAVEPAVMQNSPSSITAVPEHRGTGVPERKAVSASESKTSSQVIPTSNFYRKANEVVDQLDRELTPAESKIFDHLIRLSVGFNKDWCQVRISTLQQRTGYRSDKTVRAAINGLIVKGRIARRTHHNNPLGDEYQIRGYSGNTEVPEYRSTPVENTQVLESKITGHLNTYLKEKIFDDDAALAGLIATLKDAVKQITGREVSAGDKERWRELGEVLVTELKIAAARTTVSSVPAFLAEHLRRRLWKIDKKQAQAEGKELPDASAVVRPNDQTDKCPDCGGTGWWYPEGSERGVAKCKHERLEGKLQDESNQSS